MRKLFIDFEGLTFEAPAPDPPEVEAPIPIPPEEAPAPVDAVDAEPVAPGVTGVITPPPPPPAAAKLERLPD